VAGCAAQVFCILEEKMDMSKSPIEKRYTETEALSLLGLKSRITLYRWRRLKLIGFYRQGNKVYYGDHHIRDFWARCERKAKGTARESSESLATTA